MMGIDHVLRIIKQVLIEKVKDDSGRKFSV